MVAERRPNKERKRKGFVNIRLSLTRRIDRVGLKFKLFLLHSHHNGSPWQVYSRTRYRSCWGGRLSASTAGELYGVPKSTARAWLQKYRRDGQVGRHRRTGLWRVSSPAQDAALVAEAQRNPFVSARDLKAVTGFPGQKTRLFRDLKYPLSEHDTLRWRSFSLTNINYTI